MTAQAPQGEATKPPNIIRIDGREIPFEPGDTIIKAAHRAGIDIPHYCWHPGLGVAANCRMCLVELPPPAGRPGAAPRRAALGPGEERLRPGLEAEAAAGVSAAVRSGHGRAQRVERARRQGARAVQELLLSTTRSTARSAIRPASAAAGLLARAPAQRKRMRRRAVHKPKAVSFGPTIVYDAERCIVCTRCVRFSEEVAKDPCSACASAATSTRSRLARAASSTTTTP
jgi:NADH-quinone oxidoreductase subunit G